MSMLKKIARRLGPLVELKNVELMWRYDVGLQHRPQMTSWEALAPITRVHCCNHVISGVAVDTL